MTKHAGYGRYDVEVNGQVVGRAVKRPEGWEATGAMKGMSVTVHGHDSLESACMAIGRALMGAEVRYELGQQPRSAAESDQLWALRKQVAAIEGKRAYYQKAERELSDAYLRLRNILGAFDTPHGPTAEQVWAHTEDRAKGLVAQLGKLREEASIWKGMHAVAIEQRDQSLAEHEAALLERVADEWAGLTRDGCIWWPIPSLRGKAARIREGHDAALPGGQPEGMKTTADVKRFVVANLKADAIQKEVVDIISDWCAEPHIYGKESEHSELAEYFENVVSRIREEATG